MNATLALASAARIFFNFFRNGGTSVLLLLLLLSKWTCYRKHARAIRNITSFLLTASPEASFRFPPLLQPLSFPWNSSLWRRSVLLIQCFMPINECRGSERIAPWVAIFLNKARDLKKLCSPGAWITFHYSASQYNFPMARQGTSSQYQYCYLDLVIWYYLSAQPIQYK